MGIVLDPHQLEIDEFTNLGGNRLRRWHRLLQPASSGAARGRLWRRQHNPASLLQRTQGFQTAGPLRAPSGIDKTKLGTHLIRQCRAMRLRHLAQQGKHLRYRLWLAQCALDLALRSHGDHSKAKKSVCPALDVGIGQH